MSNDHNKLSRMIWDKPVFQQHAVVRPARDAAEISQLSCIDGEIYVTCCDIDRGEKNANTLCLVCREHVRSRDENTAFLVFGCLYRDSHEVWFVFPCCKECSKLDDEDIHQKFELEMGRMLTLRRH